MSTVDNLAVVKAFYSALERGDEQGLINLNSSNALWIDYSPENSGFRGDWQGAAGIEAFLTAQDMAQQMNNFLVQSMLPDGDNVVCVVDTKVTPRATDFTETGRMVQIFTLQDERITQIETFPSISEAAYD